MTYSFSTFYRSYPSVDPATEPVLLSRANLSGEVLTPFTFSRFNNQWIYIVSTAVDHEEEEEDDDEEDKTPTLDTGKEYKGPLGRVDAFSICLCCKVCRL